VTQRNQQLFTRTLTVVSTASTTTAGTAFPLPVGYNAMLVFASLASHTGGTIDVYLQDSFDGGTTWLDCAHFTQVGAASTRKEAAAIQLSSTLVAIGSGTVGTPGVGLAAATLRSAPWGPLLRIVAVTGGGTSGADKVQTITFVPTDYEP
jgi:hypothetical protein